MITTLIIGSAGSGKTLLTSALKEHLTYGEESVIAVNLDPAAKKVPYSPDVDVREYIDIDEIMAREELGPNASLIAAYEEIAGIVDEINADITYYSPDVTIVDTPGQLELFILKRIGVDVINQMIGDEKISFFLIDALASLDPRDLITQLWLSSICQFRLKTPVYNVVSRIDLIKERQLREVCRQIDNPETIRYKLTERRTLDELDMHILEYLENLEPAGEVLAASAVTKSGLKTLHRIIDEYKQI